MLFGYFSLLLDLARWVVGDTSPDRGFLGFSLVYLLGFVTSLAFMSFYYFTDALIKKTTVDDDDLKFIVGMSLFSWLITLMILLCLPLVIVAFGAWYVGNSVLEKLNSRLDRRLRDEK